MCGDLLFQIHELTYAYQKPVLRTLNKKEDFVRVQDDDTKEANKNNKNCCS